MDALRAEIEAEVRAELQVEAEPEDSSEGDEAGAADSGKIIHFGTREGEGEELADAKPKKSGGGMFGSKRPR